MTVGRAGVARLIGDNEGNSSSESIRSEPPDSVADAGVRFGAGSLRISEGTEGRGRSLATSSSTCRFR